MDDEPMTYEEFVESCKDHDGDDSEAGYNWYLDLWAHEHPEEVTDD